MDKSGHSNETVPTTDVKPHPCDIGEAELDHDWRYVSDFSGDCGVINGTYDCGYYECTVCGEVKQGEPPEYDFEDNYF